MLNLSRIAQHHKDSHLKLPLTSPRLHRPWSLVFIDRTADNMIALRRAAAIEDIGDIQRGTLLPPQLSVVSGRLARKRGEGDPGYCSCDNVSEADPPKYGTPLCQGSCHLF